jgi:hypothetical protein
VNGKACRRLMSRGATDDLVVSDQQREQLLASQTQSTLGIRYRTPIISSGSRRRAYDHLTAYVGAPTLQNPRNVQAISTFRVDNLYGFNGVIALA